MSQTHRPTTPAPTPPRTPPTPPLELVKMCRAAILLTKARDWLKSSLEKDPILFAPGSLQRGAKVIPPRPNGKPRVKRGVANIRLDPEAPLRVNRAAAYGSCVERLWAKAEDVQRHCRWRCPAPPGKPTRDEEFGTAVRCLYDWAVRVRWEKRRQDRPAAETWSPAAAPADWTPYKTVTVWAKLFDVGRNTMAKRLKAQTPRNERFNRQNYRLAVEDLPPHLRAKFTPPA